LLAIITKKKTLKNLHLYKRFVKNLFFTNTAFKNFTSLIQHLPHFSILAAATAAISHFMLVCFAIALLFCNDDTK